METLEIILLFILTIVGLLLLSLWLYIYFFAPKQVIKKEKKKHKFGKRGLKT